MPTRVTAPHHWLDDLAAALDRALHRAPVQGAISGPGWVSLRVGGRFLWLVATGSERLAWLGERPLSRTHLGLLGRHARSPFPSHLRERVVTGVRVLETEGGQADGLELATGPGNGPLLRARWFPRPGAIWLVSAEGEDLARQGRMDGAALRTREARPSGGFDLAAHAAACERTLAARLREQTARTLRQRLDRDLKRTRRRLWSLEGEQEKARRDRRARAVADLLAAHLHELPPGRSSVRLTGFDGEEVEIELDPALPAHANLDRWYKRAGRAERKEEQVAGRIEATRAELEAIEGRRAALEAELEADADLDALLAFAATHELDPAPRTPKPASERRAPDPGRLPYWRFDLAGWELRVGRSARDNDLLTTRHSHPRDLWLHAQGVPGSHVVIRSAGRHVPGDVLRAAARVAAHHSRARTSSTVAVLCTERRYVRKPRKAAPGQVAVERETTLFVEPGIPDRCVRVDREDDAVT